MTRDEQACEHEWACVYVLAVYVRHYLVVCIVGNTWTVKLASQCFFRFKHRLYVPFRTYKWQNIIHTEAMQTDCCCVSIHRCDVQC